MVDVGNSIRDTDDQPLQGGCPLSGRVREVGAPLAVASDAVTYLPGEVKSRTVARGLQDLYHAQ